MRQTYNTPRLLGPPLSDQAVCPGLLRSYLLLYEDIGSKSPQRSITNHSHFPRKVIVTVASYENIISLVTV